METVIFDKLLLQTAFCCIACDGNLDKKEIKMLKSIFEGNEFYTNTNFDDKINSFIKIYNEKGKDFFTFYFELLKSASLSEKEELSVIDVAIRTIKADEQIDYSEIKFFKVIRSNLKLSDEKILASYPDIEQFLEQDIVTESHLEKITNHYLNTVELPMFELISLDTGNLEKNDESN